MTDTLIAIASVVAYLAAGFTVAARRRPVMWEKAREGWHYEDSIRSSVALQFVATVLAWWVYLPAAWLYRSLNEFTAAADPVELARQAREREQRIRERERRIAELEAENERLRRQQEDSP